MRADDSRRAFRRVPLIISSAKGKHSPHNPPICLLAGRAPRA